VFGELGASVEPRAGWMLLFRHRLLHESRPVVRGTKYALRADVMYSSLGIPQRTSVAATGQ
jgi:hypothetical protein